MIFVLDKVEDGGQPACQYRFGADGKGNGRLRKLHVH